MSAAEHLPFSPLAIKIWSVISIVFGLFLLSMFVFGSCYLAAGHCVWDFIRRLFLPII